METMRPAAYWFQLVCKHVLCVHGHVIVMGSIILSSWVESGRQWGWNNVAILPVKGRGCLRKGYERTAEVWGAERDIRMALLGYWIQLGLKQLCHWTSQYMNQLILHPTLFFLFCFVQFFEPVWVGFCHSEPKASCLNLVTKPKWEYGLVNTIKLFSRTPRIDFRAEDFQNYEMLMF